VAIDEAGAGAGERRFGAVAKSARRARDAVALDWLQDAVVDVRWKPIEAGTATGGESPAAVALDRYERWTLAPDHTGESAEDRCRRRHPSNRPGRISKARPGARPQS
jgi:hypothetical protein